ncbi:protein DpdD [Mycolicibacterium fortuitum]|uniref:protein DpdD n=1 Tax=Mycolicibacterium fortuitum TaxID=1766 RepID=UPI0022A7528F|nr:protein DpdD [Mycolicibacterium fortuitum]
MGVAPADLEGFLNKFFGPGNNYWSDRDPQSQTGRRLRPYLESATTDAEVPYILPRLGPQQNRLIYVIPRSSVQGAMVREWVDAFVVPSYAPYSSRGLDSNDPIDAAVVEFAGHNRILLLDVQPETSSDLWAALWRLVDSVGRKPVGVGVAPLPLSRLLAEFDLALAAGESAASAALLERLSGKGLSGSNYINLVIKRLARLGRYSELLRLPGLMSVARSDPPGPIKDAILTAIYYQLIESPLAAGDVEAAKQQLLNRGDLVPPLASRAFGGFSSESLTVLAIAAAVRQGDELGDKLELVPGVLKRLTELVPDVAESSKHQIGSFEPPVQVAESTAEVVATYETVDESNTLGELETSSTSEAQVDTSSEPIAESQAAQPESWPELFATTGAGTDVRDCVTNEVWRNWPTPAADDEEIAAVIAKLDDAAAARAWSLAGPFIDADDFGSPAPKSAQALIDIALLLGRFGPADLAGLVALSDIVLRSAPADANYTRLVDDLNEDVARWASVERSSVELDLADMLARNASPNPEARLRLTTRLLEPLSRQCARISVDELNMARRIDRELGLGLTWAQPEEAQSIPQHIEGNLLLYSLDEPVLSRVESALVELAPGLSVRSSHDRVGSPQLRDWCRRADYIVLAVRCAKHAATGFIRQHASGRTVVIEANGGGSASLLRAAMNAIQSGPALARTGS